MSGPPAEPEQLVQRPSPPHEDPDHADHGHDAPATSGTTSGPLTRRDFPRPRELGPGWSYDVDMGGPEDGFTGNGTPALERDPAELAMLAVPLGCARPVELPVANHALEVRYRADQIEVVTVRVAFDDVATARRFFRDRLGLLHDCQGRQVSEGEGVLVGTVRRISPTTAVNDRTVESDPWTELSVRDGAHVVLMAARAPLDRPPMTPTSIRSLTDALRR